MHELKRMRQLDGMSQERLARKARVAVSTITKIERDGHRPRLDTRRRLLRALDCPFDLHLLVFGGPPRTGNRYTGRRKR